MPLLPLLPLIVSIIHNSESSLNFTLSMLSVPAMYTKFKEGQKQPNNNSLNDKKVMFRSLFGQLICSANYATSIYHI
ncbi:Uncharacterized protein BM_BM18054 [Brugia malayi]|uniref:Uncharacterized protein n=1 Tax=Brugia malayi TaxID=6279 RepID=A0A4E9F0A7_BRUMA|nr:Uncharacterized protein BM_BM18054 [Brugia malayi]VIO89436.1 Uncharacterized protein BM_BM18054 [Brugia malayi]